MSAAKPRPGSQESLAQHNARAAMWQQEENRKLRDALKKIRDAEIMSTWEMKAIAREALGGGL